MWHFNVARRGGRPTGWPRGGRVGQVEAGLRSCETITGQQHGLLTRSYYPVGPVRRRRKIPNETTTKAAFVGLLSPCSPLLPESYYPSLSNCARVFSPVKTHIGADALIVTLRGGRTLQGMPLKLGAERNQDYQRMVHTNPRAALGTGGVPPKFTAFCLST